MAVTVQTTLHTAYPGCRYAHRLLDQEDYREELEMKISISLLEQAPVGRAHLSGPRTV
jgi:hypothetical protein